MDTVKGEVVSYSVWTPELEPIEYAPIVRCKDCKHYGFTDNRVPEEQVWWCYKWSREMKENDFCSYGEREDE